ncbi:MAG: hypothetical protein EAZ47_04440 [Bacteroidetes bacterium]|nr:MAG: hypothetical protein EAY72_02785 [Bacteroidota bacterium]TAE69627.1 MAG: hypothetical protein EAY68_03430 [Bacteroidota bacterium]TAF94152.1 MAG: hypothetical protein EAZ47_04440 [Bacteroidota bacterium]
MKPNSTIQNELTELQYPLLASGIANAFTVEEGYFPQLADRILLHSKMKVAAEGASFQAPANYFEQLPTQILEAIRFSESGTEVETHLPTLAQATKQMPYHVPAQYFENIQPLTVAKPKSKLVAFSKQSWLKWAAAAVLIAGLFSTAIIFYSRTENVENLASTQGIEQVSDEEIQQYLNHNDVVHLLTNTAVQENTTEDADHSFEMISDEEIQQYLQEMEAAEKNIKEI